MEEIRAGQRIAQFFHDTLIFLGLVMSLGIILVAAGWYQFAWQRVGGSGTYVANIQVLDLIEEKEIRKK